MGTLHRLERKTTIFVVQASIGRNIGSEPLSRSDWVHFINDVSDAIREQNEKPEFHFGTGVWEGISEDSAHITVYRANITDEYRYAIRQNLARIAFTYGQEAIALTISESELIPRLTYR